MSHQCYEVDNKLSKSLKICDSLVTFFSKGRTPLPYPSMLGYTCLEEKTIMLNFAFQVLRKCLVDKIKQFVTILKLTFEHPTPPPHTYYQYLVENNLRLMQMLRLCLFRWVKGMYLYAMPFTHWIISQYGPTHQQPTLILICQL